MRDPVDQIFSKLAIVGLLKSYPHHQESPSSQARLLSSPYIIGCTFSLQTRAERLNPHLFLRLSFTHAHCSCAPAFSCHFLLMCLTSELLCFGRKWTETHSLLSAFSPYRAAEWNWLAGMLVNFTLGLARWEKLVLFFYSYQRTIFF